MLDYLTTATTALGPYAWTFLVVQGAALLAGIYLLAINQDTHPVRGPLLRRLGIVLAIAGAAGVLLGVGRALGLGPLTLRWWFYALAVVELVLAAYAIYYYQAIYPQQMAAYRASTRSRRSVGRPSSRDAAANGSASSAAAAAPRPEPLTTRRAARRERKRRR